MANWYELSPDQAKEIDSPALLVYPERVEANIQSMIRIAGGTERLRPHVKTHKMSEVIKLHLKHGLNRFKCATIAEAEMLAETGAKEVLLAYQPVGPRAARLLSLAQVYPEVKFMAIADDESVIRNLAKLWSGRGFKLEVLLDLDTGFHRTGIAPGPEALELYRLIYTLPSLSAGGLHAYDGHLRSSDFLERKTETDIAYLEVMEFQNLLETENLPIPRIVAGGSPTFPVHAMRASEELSPGTYVFWDAGYAKQFPEIEFQHAAVLIGRVLSKPGEDRLCIDIGHKAVASENPIDQRIIFLNLEVEEYLGHSEEHLMLRSLKAAEMKVGDVIYGIPWHICPTVALHQEAKIIRKGSLVDQWKVTARDRSIGF